MKELDLVLLIIPRSLDDAYMDFFALHQCSVVHSFPCNGTAGKNLLQLLGLENTDKTAFLLVEENRKAHKLLRKSETEMGLDMPGNGIAALIPLDSIGEKSLAALLSETPGQLNQEDSSMSEKNHFPFSLLTAVCKNGTHEMVMEAAREGGAGGGTVLHVRSADAMRKSSRFLGVSLAEQKEVLLILVNQENKKDIMRSIMTKAGMDTECKTVLFTLPVEEVFGLRSVLKNEDDEE